MKFNLIISTLLILSACKGQNSTMQSQNEASRPRESMTQGSAVSSMDPAIMIIFQDSKSNYWFGSMDQGVYKFDGKQLIRFTKADGLSSNRIRSIQEDKFGNIFFDSGEGITKFDGISFTKLMVADNSTNKWRLNPNDLWFEGKWNENGPYRFDGDSLFHLEFSDHPLEKVFSMKFPNSTYSPYDVYSIYQDREGDLWFGTCTLGVCRYNGKTMEWISEEELTELDDGPALGIRSIIEDKEGNFWFSKPFHRYSISRNSSSDQDVLQYKMLDGLDQFQAGFDGFMSATKDTNQNLWMVTYDQGVWKYDGAKITHYPIEEDGKMVTLYSIYNDHENNLWLGTHHAGPYKFNGQTFKKFNP